MTETDQLLAELEEAVIKYHALGAQVEEIEAERSRCLVVMQNRARQLAAIAKGLSEPESARLREKVGPTIQLVVNLKTASDDSRAARNLIDGREEES
jgi:hypothetical protein